MDGWENVSWIVISQAVWQSGAAEGQLANQYADGVISGFMLGKSEQLRFSSIFGPHRMSPPPFYSLGSDQIWVPPPPPSENNLPYPPENVFEQLLNK